MPKQTFRLTLKSTYEESEKIPDFVLDIQDKCSLNEDVTSTLMLLASEAVTNAIEHGNRSDPSKIVKITINVLGDKIITHVIDQGEGFKPEEAVDPLKDENLLNTSGRGIFLIQELSDEVEFLNEGREVQFVIYR
ncbi:MAG: ATP-binding protein [Balneolaceae bacterium]|nr:MAG: ATP-binding protein [Balneolaceae bacterium]